eukprot:scaffold21.g2090.t1
MTDCGSGCYDGSATTFRRGRPSAALLAHPLLPSLSTASSSPLPRAVEVSSCQTRCWTCTSPSCPGATVYYFTSNFWNNDVKARKDGLAALRKLPPQAAILLNLLPDVLTGGMAPSLCAALEACLDRCAATLQHDEQRLEQLELQELEWQERPFRTLLRSAMMLAGRLKEFFWGG